MSTKSTSVPLDLEGILARLEPHAKELGGLVVLISFLALWLLNQGEWVVQGPQACCERFDAG
jgi:hypothetical protein